MTKHQKSANEFPDLTCEFRRNFGGLILEDQFLPKFAALERFGITH